jgi:hypothetical protein
MPRVALTRDWELLGELRALLAQLVALEVLVLAVAVAVLH